MKKYIIIGSIGLVAIAAGFGVWRTHQQTTISHSLLGFVPATYDQMLYSIPDAEMFEGLQKVGHIEALSGTQELLSSTNELAIWQYVYNEEPLVLLFLDVRPDFSFAKAAQMGLLATGDDMKYEDLGNRRYVYGDAASLAYYHANQSGSVADSELGKEFLQTFIEKKGHIGFLSQPSALIQAGQNPIVEQFAQKLQGTFAWSRLSPVQQQGEITLRFREPAIAEPSTPFVPELANSVTNDSAVYLEMRDLFGLFGVNDTQVTGLLPLLAQQAGGVYANLLGPNDWQTIAKIGKGHISITLAPSATLPGVGLRLVVDNKELYPILQKLSPFVSGLLEKYSGTGSVRTEQGQQVSRWSVTLGGPGGMSFPVLTMSQTGNTTQLDILGSIVSSPNAKALDLEYMNTSYLSFVLNSATLQQLLTALSPLGLSAGAAMPAMPTAAIGSGSTIYGELHTQDSGKELVLSFKAE